MKSVNNFGIPCHYRLRRRRIKRERMKIQAWEADRAWREEKGSGAQEG